MEIKNTNVYGLDDSLVKSGYPARVDPEMRDKNDRDIKRAQSLADKPANSGHNSFMKGIIVKADFRMPQYWWIQAERYHWFEIESSESKMYTLLQGDIEERCNDEVSYFVLYKLEELIKAYKKEKEKGTEKEKLRYFYQVIISNVPMGFELTAGVTTNYLQLKNIYNQRRTHRLEEWEYVCDWIEKLPRSELITGEYNDKK